jgi:hypothetical protein
MCPDGQRFLMITESGAKDQSRQGLEEPKRLVPTK